MEKVNLAEYFNKQQPSRCKFNSEALDKYKSYINEDYLVITAKIKLKNTKDRKIEIYMIDNKFAQELVEKYQDKLLPKDIECNYVELQEEIEIEFEEENTTNSYKLNKGAIVVEINNKYLIFDKSESRWFNRLFTS